MRSKSDISLESLPPTRLPAIDIELIRVERCDRHGRVRSNGIIGGYVVRTQLEPAVTLVTELCQSVHRQVWIGQDVIIDNVVEKYGVWIESVR